VNKNNFFVKFAYFNKCNIIGVRDRIIDIKDDIIEMLEPLTELLIDVIVLILLIFSVFIPVIKIALCFISKYVTDDELGKLGLSVEVGYYAKRSIKSIEDKITKEAV